jgi:hypothetical protein
LNAFYHSFPKFGLFFLTLGALGLPTVASADTITYTAAIVVEDTSNTVLGYVQDDPNYYTPQITSSVASALIVSFTLNGTSGNQVNLTTQNSSETAFTYLGLVQGRSNTSANIGSGNFNYLYLDNTNATAPGSTPQLAGNYFSTTSGGSYAGESAVWDIDVNALTLVPAWINSDSSMPTTVVFVQSNHVYAGGDASAFHTEFPAPVTSATLQLDILSSAVSSVPEPATLCTVAVGVLGLAALRRGKRSSS